MASLAIHLTVFSDQGKVGLVVVEFGCRGKGIGGMTGGTIRTQGALMGILMTHSTILGKSKEGIFPLANLAVVDQVRFVTLPAVDLLVRTSQLIAGQFVVKRLLIKPDHLKLATMMFAVTGRTFLSFDLP